MPRGCFNRPMPTPTSPGPASCQPIPTGLHVINVWMREDGFAFDKLLLSSNPTFNPTGIGPAESPVSVLGPTIALTVSAEGNLILTWQGGGVLQSAPSISSTFSDIPG